MADKLCSKLGTGVSAGLRTKWQNEFPKVLSVTEGNTLQTEVQGAAPRKPGILKESRI